MSATSRTCPSASSNAHVTYKLLSAPNCVFTPHVAFLTEEAMQRRAKVEFDNVLAYVNGTPENVCEL